LRRYAVAASGAIRDTAYSSPPAVEPSVENASGSEPDLSARRPVMNHARKAIAVSVLALGAAALGATTAVATHPAENGTVPAIVVPRDPPPTRTIGVPIDDTMSEAFQAAAAALGGAGLALVAVRIHRRRPARSSVLR
jgi:hypothetical protein